MPDSFTWESITSDKLCSSISENMRPYALELAENVIFMGQKLEDTRRGLANQQVVIAYDNGGGQKGIRKNPIFEGYNQLMANFRKTAEQLCALMKESGAADDDGGNPLASILAEAEAVLVNA